MFGQMIEAIMASGKIIKCMVLVSLHGQMEESMKEIIMMTRNKEEVSLHGLITENMMVSGTMENSMEKVYTIHLKEKLKEENGKMAKDYVGY